MVNAFVLINIEGKNIKDIAKGLMAVDGVTEVYPVAGEYDFIVVVRVSDNVTLARVITEDIIHKGGVRHTKTLFALDSYAKINLPAAFGVK
jgi:DNA-binding Lrp family transcriptional regulator